MKKLTILLDMDDVLNNQNELWVKRLNDTFHTDVKYEDISEWNMAKRFPELSRTDLYAPLLSGELVPNMTPQSGSVEITDEWNIRGHTILIVTSTSTSNIHAKYGWISQYYSWFTPNNLILTNRKQFVRGDVLIDDGVHNLLPDTETGIRPIYRKICMDRPWNQSFNCKKHGIYRAHNFEEIDTVIKRLEKGEEII